MKAMIYCCVVLLLSTIANAFYANGEINHYLKYEDLSVFTDKSGKNSYVSGILINRTDDRVKVWMEIYFADIFNDWEIKSQKIIATLKPRERVLFEKKIKTGHARAADNAHHVIWHIVKLKANGKVVLKNVNGNG